MPHAYLNTLNLSHFIHPPTHPCNKHNSIPPPHAYRKESLHNHTG